MDTYKHLLLKKSNLENTLLEQIIKHKAVHTCIVSYSSDEVNKLYWIKE